MTTRTVNILLYAGITVCAVILSQISGYLVNLHIAEFTTVELNSWVHFTHLRNHGGVFGMLQGHGWIFASFSGLVLVAVSYYLYLSQQLPRYEYVCYGLIAGGGASNVLDRLIYGSVIDFIDIQHIPYWNYVFNTADVLIHLGIWPLLFLGLTQQRWETWRKH